MRTTIVYILCSFIVIFDIWFTLYLLNEELFFVDNIRDLIRKKIQSYYGRKSNTLLEEDQNGD